MTNRIEDFENKAHAGREKFEYSMTSFTVGALALSFNFSPQMGSQYAWILVSGWIFLFISFILGGWRLMFYPSAMLKNVWVVKNESHLNQLRNRQPGQIVLHPETGARQNDKELKESINSTQKIIDKNKKEMESFQIWAPRIYNIQVTLLIVGLGCIGTYRSLNIIP